MTEKSTLLLDKDTVIQEEVTAKPQTFLRKILLPVLLISLGIIVMIYPVIASQWNNISQRSIAEQYHQELKKIDPEVLNKQLKSAEEYNKNHVAQPILDPWLSRVAPDNELYRKYAAELNGLPEMSQIVIPKIRVSLPVYHGTDPKTLEKGVGHLFGTSLPVGGEGTHSVLSGHTGLTNATLFDDLDKIVVGDVFYLNTYGKKLKYQVESVEIVLPDKTESLTPVAGKDLVTLITCTPYGINTERILVHGVRVQLDDVGADDVFNQPLFIMQWWMWVVVVVALILIVLLIWWIMYIRKKMRLPDTANN